MNTKKLNKATIVSLCLILVFSLFAVIPQANAASSNLKVTATALNIRTAPNTSSKVYNNSKKEHNFNKGRKKW